MFKCGKINQFQNTWSKKGAGYTREDTVASCATVSGRIESGSWFRPSGKERGGHGRELREATSVANSGSAVVTIPGQVR